MGTTTPNALPDLDDTTSRQDDIENRYRVIFAFNYRSTAPGLPFLLVNRAKSENGAGADPGFFLVGGAPLTDR